MPSAGETKARIDRFLRGVRANIDAFGLSFEEALATAPIPDEDRDEVRRRWQQDHDVTIRRVSVLTGEGGGRRPWFDDFDPADGYHWPRLRSWLLSHKGRSEAIVESLDDASDHVLAHLEDPSREGPAEFRIQGLVLGRVQSGKTANFTAVIAKAVDAGYRFVIVLSGIHNSLRVQTQQRLIEELGLSDEAGLNKPGVGKPDAERQWVSITTNTLSGDFRKGTFDATVLQGNENVIAVVKKNATVLRRLNEWLDGRPVGAHLPVLVIDDEADQASINTGGNRPGRIEESDDDVDVLDIVDIDDTDTDGTVTEDLDPSVINGLIRSMLNKFEKVAYVAYTATPFANVLIDPHASDYRAGMELYPKDFLIALPTPAAYVGAAQLFGHDPVGDGAANDGLPVIELVPDHEIPYLTPRGRQPWEATVTPTLRVALIDYVLATAAKLERLGNGISTMLIHTTHRKLPQIEIGDVVREELRNLRQSWRYPVSDERVEFQDRWNDNHRPLITSLNVELDRSFETLEPHITQLMKDGIDVAVLNSDTEDQLGYDHDPNRKVIVIGGNRLSRGLTLEELVVSYYVRNSANYDTLLQMGRWFGYRADYVDLTRLWTTETLYRNFRHLALVEEDLREQILSQEHLTPLEAAPLILAHPEMNVTAANKMGAGREINVSYAGQLVQSVRFNLDDPAWLERNLDTTCQFISALGTPAQPDPARPDDRPHWRDVSPDLIADFVRQFLSPAEANSFHPTELADYIRRQADEHNELQRWWVSIRTRGQRDPALGTIDLGGAVGDVNAISRSRLKNDRLSVGVLTNPARARGAMRTGDEELGLADAQIAAARAALAEDRYHRYGTALRHQRGPNDGLLCVYPISPNSTAANDGRRNPSNRVDLFPDPDRARPVIGVAIVFPPSTSAATKTLIGGPVGDPTR